MLFQSPLSKPKNDEFDKVCTVLGSIQASDSVELRSQKISFWCILKEKLNFDHHFCLCQYIIRLCSRKPACREQCPYPLLGLWTTEYNQPISSLHALFSGEAAILKVEEKTPFVVSAKEN